jgi:hypothetical protein
MQLGIYVMVSEPIAMANFINTSYRSICLYVHVVRQRLGKYVTSATNTQTTIEELLAASFSIWSVSY